MSIAARFIACVLVLTIWAADAVAQAAERRFADLNGNRIAYVSSGQGVQAVVLVHGWACDRTLWRLNARSLAERHRVIALDLPGHGESDAPHIEYTQDLFVEAIDAVLKDAGVQRAVLVGHSMGGHVIRHYYRKHPQQVAGLVIVDWLINLTPPATQPVPPNPWQQADYKQKLADAIKGMCGPKLPAELCQEIEQKMLGTPQHVIASTAEHMLEAHTVTPDVIQVPALMVMDAAPAGRAEDREFAQHLIMQLDYVGWEGVGHFLMMERPREFNRLLIEFLDKTGLNRHSPPENRAQESDGLKN